MKYVCDYNKCSNCKACVSVCKKNAIHIVDDIRACNAVIDEEACVNCGMCEKICPTENPISKQKPTLWRQGWASEPAIRQASSSGGAATAIQYGFIEAGGVVCSCCFDNGVYGFGFATETSALRKFVGSKYVKSDPDKAYAKIKTILEGKQKVLFVGLPCQCAAVKKYTNGNALLYTVDLICHGTPSQKLLDMFLREKGYQPENMKNLTFRQKLDWYLSDGDKSVEPKSVRDRYMIAFLKSLCYTENCYSCPYASLERVSDLTLGDSWGSALSEEEQKKGISLVLCQTEKGKELLEIAKIELMDVDLDIAVRNNQQLNAPSIKPDKYELFFRELHKRDNFSKAVKKCYFKLCIRQEIKAFLVKYGFIKIG